MTRFRTLHSHYTTTTRRGIRFGSILFENVKGKQLVERFAKTIQYIETPIEVGLSIEGFRRDDHFAD